MTMRCTWVPPRETSAFTAAYVFTPPRSRSGLPDSMRIDRRLIAEERETMTRQGITQRESMPGDGKFDVTIARVRFEHHRDAFGVGESRPRLSWIVDTVIPAWHQGDTCEL